MAKRYYKSNLKFMRKKTTKKTILLNNWKYLIETKRILHNIQLLQNFTHRIEHNHDFCNNFLILDEGKSFDERLISEIFIKNQIHTLNLQMIDW